MFNNKFRQRLNDLFADIERLAADPACNSLEIRRDLDALRARLCKLEAEFSEGEKLASTIQETVLPASTKNVDVRPDALVLYEKEQVAYTYTGDKLASLQDSSLDVPLSDRALTTLLTASGQTIGEMQIESPPERLWTSEEMNLANSVAQQASLQIQNLRLLAATERARAEAETATRRFMHEGWDSYLDAIHQNERIGYAYDQTCVKSYEEKLPVNSGFHEPMALMDEQVGALYIKADPSHPLTNDDKQLMAAVAHQVAQQVENIRLLADASRARAEAEEATRRLTRDSWESYTAGKDETAIGFVYDSNQVIPLEKSPQPQQMNFVQPLTVRGETIGQLAVAGWKDVPPEATYLASSVAAQVSIHLETLRLAEELRKRAAELQELDRLKSAFLANMSHELRTPLNSILGFSDVILEQIDGPLTDTMKNDLQLIQKNGQHLLHLINDVLDMAKIEAGRINLAPERFMVHEILDEVLSITSTLASERNLSLFVEADSDNDVEIFADRTRLRQVMINLINNSIKFTEKGRITIHASRQGTENVLIRVKDTGVGIPSDKLEAIFQEFAQVDTSSTRKAGGTGLGLPISRRLIELHGGRLWAESSGVSGEGSTFYVELPIEARITEPIEKQEK
jgi:signal transduction histidine kinase